MKKELSIPKMLVTDYIAFTSWLTPLIFFIAHYITKGGYDTGTSNLLIVAIVSAILGASLIIWRIWLFRDIFENGQLVEGVITKLYFYRSRGHITFSFTYHSEQYKHKAVIQKMSFRFKYKTGDHVTIILDPQNPKRAFIRDLYADA